VTGEKTTETAVKGFPIGHSEANFSPWR